MAERAGYFVAIEGQPRVRRARDAVRVGVGLIFMLTFASDAVRLGQLQEAMTDVVRSLPGWTEVLFWVAYGAAAIYAAGMIVAVLIRARRHVGAARDVVLAAAVALVIAVLAMRWQEGVWPMLLPEFGGEGPVPMFPMIRVAVVREQGESAFRQFAVDTPITPDKDEVPGSNPGGPTGEVLPRPLRGSLVNQTHPNRLAQRQKPCRQTHRR